jgi:hypothetical protein
MALFLKAATKATLIIAGQIIISIAPVIATIDNYCKSKKHSQ